MNLLSPVRHLSVSVARDPAEVYAYVSAPQNLPRWAAGLSGSIECVDGAWVAESPFGRVTVRFVTSNPLGVVDHEVVDEAGNVFHNQMRVLRNGDGSEVLFTLLKRPDVSEAAFEADTEAVLRDLEQLKEILEGS